MYVATIDAGTTNTRAVIWQGDNIVGLASEPIGVRETAIAGNNQKLTAAIAATLRTAAAIAGITVDDLALVLATGMLTSNVGLIEIPHIIAPVSSADLAAAMVSVAIPAICATPIWFIPGIKNLATTDLSAQHLAQMDIMRGEEVEVSGLIARLNLQGAAVIILPGSHNKYIALDEMNRIVGSMTTLAGELLRSLTMDTILADTVQRGFATKFDEVAVRLGAAYGESLGLGRAAFMTRILNLFADYTPEQAQNYLLGLILADDLRALQGSQLFSGYIDAPVIVAGKPVVQAAYQTLLATAGADRPVKLVDQQLQIALAGFGALALARQRGLI